MKRWNLKNIIRNERGASMLEVLVASVIGVIALAVVAGVSTGALQVFSTTKVNTQNNNDNYNVTTILQQLANDATSVSQSGSGSGSSIDLTMNPTNPPKFLPSQFQKDVKNGTTFTLSWTGNKLTLSDSQKTQGTLYSNTKVSQNPSQDSFSLQVPNPNSNSNIFELAPPSALNSVKQPVFFQTDVLPGSGTNGGTGTGGAGSNVMNIVLSNPTYNTLINEPCTIYGVAYEKGNPYTGSIAISGTGVNGSFQTTVTPNSNGNFSYTFTPGSVTGNEQILAIAGGTTAKSTIYVNLPGIKITPLNQSISIGTPQSYTVTVTDNGQAVSDQQQVNISVSNNVGSFSSGTATTNSNGQAVFKFTAGATAGSGTITATVDGVKQQTGITINGPTIAFDAPSYTAWATQPIIISGTAANAGVAYKGSITITGTGVDNSFLAPVVTPDPTTGKFSFVYTPGTQAGSEKFAASAGGSQPVTTDLTINPLGVSISPQSKNVLIGSTQTYTVTVTAGNNPVSNQPVTIVASSNTGSFSSGTATMDKNTDSNGQAVFTFTAGATAGSGVITVSVDKEPPVQTDITINDPTIAFDAASYTAWASQPITISGTAAYAGVAYTGPITITGSGVDNSFLATVTPDANGNFSFVYTPGTQAGSGQFLASAGGSPPVTTDLTINPLGVSISPQSKNVLIGSTQTYTVTVTAGNNPLKKPVSVTIVASSNKGGTIGSFSPSKATTNSKDQATFNFTAGNTAETGTITATVGGVQEPPIGISVQGPTITFDQPSYNMPFTQSLTISGTVMLGNVPYTKPITITGTGIGVSFTETVDLTNGNFSFTYTAPTSASGNPAPGNEQLTVNAGGSSGSVSIGVFTPSMTISPTIPAAGILVNTTQTFTVTMTGNDGPVRKQAVTIGTTGGGSFNQTTGVTNSDGQVPFTFTAGTATGTYKISASSDGVNATSSFKIVGATVSVSVNPATVNGGSSTTVSGNVTFDGAGLAGKKVTLSATGANGTFASSNVTTSSDGSYSTTYSTQIASMNGVEWFGNSSQPTIVINGSGFGSQTGSIVIFDNSWNSGKKHWWDNGYGTFWDNFHVLSWTDNQIIIQPSTNLWYGNAYGYDQNFLFNQQDSTTIQVYPKHWFWDGGVQQIQSTVNYQSDQTNVPVTITAKSDSGSANATLTVSSETLPTTNPTINSISWHGDHHDPRIIIKGSGFGTPDSGFWGFRWFNSASSNGSLVFNDTANGGSWKMGQSRDPVSENILSWTNSKIIVKPGWGYGRGGDQWYQWFGKWLGSGDYFRSGDPVSVRLTLPGSTQSVTAQSTVRYHDNDNLFGFWGWGW